MNTLIISLGGNIGDVRSTFENAISRLCDHVGEFVEASSIYKTKAWGLEDQPDFLNQVVVFKTKLSAIYALDNCLRIELEMGRERKKKWGERIIDIDLLFFNDAIIAEERLIIPHPHLHKRNFVLAPLVEIIPFFNHPLFHQSLQNLYENCSDKLSVEKYTN